MTDLVQRLRDSVTQARAVDRAALLHEAADEIERLRNRSWPTLRYVRGGTPVSDNCVSGNQREMPYLTDAEREAVREAAGAYMDNDDDKECAEIAATLHGLLKRLQGS